jgi:hypothetical protein
MPSHRIFRLLHSTQALLVEIRREPGGRDGFPELSVSAPGERSPVED